MSNKGFKPVSNHTWDSVNKKWIPFAPSINADGQLHVVLQGKVVDENSTSTLLNADAVFTGTAISTLDYGFIFLTVFSNVVSATNGLSVQQSSDGTNWDNTDVFTIPANVGKTYSFQPAAKSFRVVYTNGVTNQASFRLQTIFKKTSSLPSSHKISDNLSPQDDGSLNISIIKGQNPSGDYVDFDATVAGNFKMSLEEFDDAFYTTPLPVASFRQLVAEGLIPGKSTTHKFGRGANIDTADGFVDIWDGSEYDNALKTYTFSTTADIDRISSSDNGDTQSLVIEGLDTNGDFVSQTKSLTGQTPVALDTSLWRVFRMYNAGSTDIAGNVFCFVNVATTAGVPDTITNTRAMIINGNNQTLMSIYTVPNGKTGYVEHWYGTLSGSKAGLCDLKMRARPFGSVFRLKHTSTLDSNGTSNIQHDFEYPQKLPGKTDMIMSANSSVNDNAVSSGFELLLVDD